MRILIADDNLLVRQTVAAIVAQNAGWEVCGEAANGLQAIEGARKWRPDLILLDIHMPGTDGLRVARQLRVEWPNLAIVIMSVEDPALLKVSALAAGASACLDKCRLGSDLVRSLRSFEAHTHSAGKDKDRNSA